MKNENYYEKETIAVYCLGLIGIEIKALEEEDGDTYVYCVCNGNKHRLKVHYTPKRTCNLSSLCYNNIIN